MLRYTAEFLVIALVAALLGFTGIAAGAAEIAKILFFIFIDLFVISLIMGLMRRKWPRLVPLGIPLNLGDVKDSGSITLAID